MQTKEKIKNKRTVNFLMSQCKINRYLSSGQQEELEKLKEYKTLHDTFTYDCGDNWYQ